MILQINLRIEKNIFKVGYSNDNDDDKDGIIFVYADRDRI